MFLRKSLNALRIQIWRIWRRKRNRTARDRLKHPDVSILSMNCTGGILSHDLGLRFLSPTINMYMQAEDFIRFCENIQHYLSVEHMTECIDPVIKDGRAYPVAYLDDIKLFLVHYSSVEYAQKKWNERKRRILNNNIVVIAHDRDGMTSALKDRFEKLPYPKVMFVHQPDTAHPSCFYIRGYEQDGEVGIVTEPKGWLGLRPVDQFDYVDFFNRAAHKENRGS